MEGKRAVSRSTQIAMEAFVPWVEHRLNDLLGIPQEDERQRVLTDVEVALKAWIEDVLLQKDKVLVDAEVYLVRVLTPWVEHQLIDLLWLQQKDEGKIVADVASNLSGILRPMIKHQLYHLIWQISVIVKADLLVQPEEDEALKVDPLLVSLIKQRLNDVLLGTEQQGDAKGQLVSLITHHLNGVLLGTEQQGDAKGKLNSLRTHHRNGVLSGKEQQGDGKCMLVSLMKNHLNDVLLGKDQQGDEKGIVSLIEQHLNDVLSGNEEQGDEKNVLVSLIKYRLRIFLGIEQGRGDEELKVEMDLLAQVEPTVSPLVKYQLRDQLKTERPRIVMETRRGLKGILDEAKVVLQEHGDNDERKKAAKKEAILWEWVDEFIGVSYEIIDVLEQWKKISVKKQVNSSVPSGVKIPGRRDKAKLKVINTKLESLLKETSSNAYFFHTYNNSNDEYGSLVTDSCVDESDIYRKDDIESVLKHLLPGIEEKRAVKVMSIVGYGGSGKTCLAKCVFNDPKVAKHFEPRVWLYVSNIFDDKQLAQDLLRSIGQDEVKEWEHDSVLFQLLEKCLSGKVFLCVFDDVWTEDSFKWIRFVRLFRSCAPGSRILVTTRSEKTALVVGSDWEHHLKPLSNKDWWSICKYGMVLNDQNKISKQMLEIGSNLADKCRGLPLAASALGQILFDKNTADEWQCELNKISDMGDEIWKIRNVALELFRHFHRSYHMLSPALKLCILYCTDFEKGTVIIVDQLIRMWMAHGYLGDSCEGDHMKTKRGFEYLSDLASHSFFLELVKGSIHKNKITSFKLNGVFHDFIRYEARHDLAALQQKRYTTVLEKRRERCFHIACYGEVPEHLNCRRWKDVSALVLSSSQLEKVPSEVGKLSHVLYLDLSNNPLKELPETICNLDCLEYLDVHRCYLLLCLPRHVQKLKQLKHLRVDYTTDELHKRLPEGFEELTLIQTLDVFRTGGSMYKDAMVKLKKFTHLADICMSVHGEVKFSDADFDTKTHLANLELCFVEEGLDQEKASKTMEDFKPPPNLLMLKFDNYPLVELPKWILELNTLTRLSFRSALNITSFPALWKLSSLEFLWLYDIAKLKHIGREFFGLPDTLQQLHPKISNFPLEEDMDYIDKGGEVSNMNSPETAKTAVSFPKLKTLRIECMKNLEKWQDITEDEKKESLVLVMPSLEELIISRCPNLQEKPLRILGDTPWFKRNSPTNPVKNVPPPSKKGSSSLPERKEEKNAPPPSQSGPEKKEEKVKQNIERYSWEQANIFLTIQKNEQPSSQKGPCSLPGEKEEKNVLPKQPSQNGSCIPTEEKEKVTETSIPFEPIVPPVAKHYERESNGLPDPPKTFDNESDYMKLLKLVQDMYILEDTTDHFEVLIPKGVLGNAEVTACLSPKDLYEWFQPRGWVFAEQLCIWSKIIYERMTVADRERVQMVSSALITSVGRKEDHPDTRAEDLVNFMIENEARLYLVPFLRPGHWELLAIVPENGAVYRFDPLQGNLKLDLTDLLESVEKTYISESPNSYELLKSWRIMDIKHKKQTGDWECGHYVMIWMLEIATTDILSLDLKEHFPFDESPYEPNELEKLKQNWCACYSSIVQKQQV